MRQTPRTLPCGVLVWATVGLLTVAATPQLPAQPDSLKFAVIGDGGTGDRPQYEVAQQMVAARASFPFDLVLMVGDNFYGSQGPAGLDAKFARPYRALAAAGVTFQAALGNHDELSTIDYPPLNMLGRRYYTFVRGPARFVVLDTNELDPVQLQWADITLRAASEPWKIVYFHHPLYSNAGRHGANVDVRVLLEPLLVSHGVQVVFAGHDHVYERLTPQRGIHHFVVGSSGQLRRGDLRPSSTSAAGFDSDRAFLLVEVTPRRLFFQAVSRTGASVDGGSISLRSTTGS